MNRFKSTSTKIDPCGDLWGGFANDVPKCQGQTARCVEKSEFEPNTSGSELMSSALIYGRAYECECESSDYRHCSLNNNCLTLSDKNPAIIFE